MQKRPELDWVGHVLRDVVTFLAENEMMQSAQMLAVAAAYVEHDMERRTLPDVQAVRVEDTKIVAFPVKRRALH